MNIKDIQYSHFKNETPSEFNSVVCNTRDCSTVGVIAEGPTVMNDVLYIGSAKGTGLYRYIVCPNTFSTLSLPSGQWIPSKWSWTQVKDIISPKMNRAPRSVSVLHGLICISTNENESKNIQNKIKWYGNNGNFNVLRCWSIDNRNIRNGLLVLKPGVHEFECYAVFSPNQLKSASHSKGAFSTPQFQG